MGTLWNLFAGALGLMLVAGSAGAGEDARTVSVTGEGKVTAPPDMATVRTGVVTESDNARAALDANNKAMREILDTLKTHDVAARDVQTTGFNVQPIYKRDDSGRTLPEVVAYRVTNQVHVRVRDLDRLGQVLDALVGAGSNQLSGIGFGIDDQAALLEIARQRAIEDARRRAETYVRTAGVRLKAVQSISEQSTAVPVPRYQARGLAADRAAAVPIATGEEELRVRVNMVFTLEDTGP